MDQGMAASLPKKGQTRTGVERNSRLLWRQSGFSYALVPKENPPTSACLGLFAIAALLWKQTEADSQAIRMK